jgi:amino acid transporter
MASQRKKMGVHAAWAMAVGGMVGGGIFSVLGVVIMVAGQWAWLAFIVAGLIAAAAAYGYAELGARYGEGGGVYSFLRREHHPRFAGTLAWALIAGYVMTISVYGFTFGHYLANAFSLGGWVPRFSALVAIAVLTAVNLRGVGDSALVELVTVWGKLIVLVGLAGIGLAHWNPPALTSGIEARPVFDAFLGAAAVFMAYEGFQLLAYDYEDLREPRRTLKVASLVAVGTVIVVYVTVALGATMLVGASTLIEQKEVALASAGQAALGRTGFWLVTIAAAFSTMSAINATLFATARLVRDVSGNDDLPSALEHRNRHSVPDRAVIAIGAAGGLLAAIGSLETLVAAASLMFIFTFGMVSAIAARQRVARRWICAAGAAGAALAGLASLYRLATTSPASIATLGALVGALWLVRRKRQPSD